MMGKRKRSSGRKHHQSPNDGSTPSSSDNMPCSSRTDQLSRERSSHLRELKTLSPGGEVLNSNGKLANVQSSHAHTHHNLGHTTFLKRSRYSYGHRYSRRNSGSHTNTSTSPGKTPSSSDGILSFKLTGQSDSDSGCQIDNRERQLSRAERISLSSCVMDVVSSDPVKMVCGICQKLLRQKPYFMGDALSSGECSVVAVLVCSHVYHADCLEQQTSLEGRHDPPCPVCSGMLCAADASRGQE